LASNERVTVNKKFERTWKKLAMAKFKILFWYIPKGLRKTYETSAKVSMVIVEPRAF
jgi:hypothetical protein